MANFLENAIENQVKIKLWSQQAMGLAKFSIIYTIETGFNETSNVIFCTNSVLIVLNFGKV